ncbi:hypothetical protein HL658_08445 [Azospirillum sp. RWY-5-1]|uniref:Uncharacterized protein n=1 Tax=Azospirillum oleiclasticum TaxID=2735135 RepID=A0ABX2T619_9PROT|nr:hypothetical protein [Azospirillum oleiclasticum]NYZ12576.1 hypothetical protein [Azospirillum oleiclasticum]NYZ19736.1 hypothetical protein [Azospirillum oleiclasticum]
MGYGMRASVVLALAGLLLPAAAGVATAADRQRVDIHVVANHAKASGQPWDGPGAVIIGPFLPDAGGPPDMVACVFGARGLERCLTHPRDPNRSACHDSADCDWNDVDVPTSVFGIAVIDLDMSQHDFVDAVVLVERAELKRSPEADRIEAAMRDFIAVRAPAVTPGEQARRDRPFQRITLSVCESAPCDLRQSRILVERTD